MQHHQQQQQQQRSATDRQKLAQSIEIWNHACKCKDPNCVEPMCRTVKPSVVHQRQLQSTEGFKIPCAPDCKHCLIYMKLTSYSRQRRKSSAPGGPGQPHPSGGGYPSSSHPGGSSGPPGGSDGRPHPSYSSHPGPGPGSGGAGISQGGSRGPPSHSGYASHGGSQESSHDPYAPVPYNSYRGPSSGSGGSGSGGDYGGPSHSGYSNASGSTRPGNSGNPRYGEHPSSSWSGEPQARPPPNGYSSHPSGYGSSAMHRGGPYDNSGRPTPPPGSYSSHGHGDPSLPPASMRRHSSGAASSSRASAVDLTMDDGMHDMSGRKTPASVCSGGKRPAMDQQPSVVEMKRRKTMEGLDDGPMSGPPGNMPPSPLKGQGGPQDKLGMSNNSPHKPLQSNKSPLLSSTKVVYEGNHSPDAKVNVSFATEGVRGPAGVATVGGGGHLGPNQSMPPVSRSGMPPAGTGAVRNGSMPPNARSGEPIPAAYHQQGESGGSLLCVVCQDNDRKMLFQPCNHISCCETCANDLNQCPICRTHIERKCHVYLA